MRSHLAAVAQQKRSAKIMRCPRCSSEKVATLNWRHPLVLHWIINPGLAFNEIVLGQRLPATSFVCKNCRKPQGERSWIECPHCQGISYGKMWMGSYAFWHWFGVYCPHCALRIPTIWNATSVVAAAILSPIWWPIWHFGKRRISAIEGKRGRAALKKFNAEQGVAPQPAARSESDFPGSLPPST